MDLVLQNTTYTVSVAELGSKVEALHLQIPLLKTPFLVVIFYPFLSLTFVLSIISILVLQEHLIT